VVEKCHFCTQRTREGRQPACQEACPTGARIFGNLLDPNSEIRYVLAEQVGVPAQGRTRYGTEVLVLHGLGEGRWPCSCSFSATAARHVHRRSHLFHVAGIPRPADRRRAIAYLIQLRQGLVVTGMSDQVSWGFYISNFAFLVGIAAAAVLLVIPAYIFHRDDIKSVVLIGEGLAVAAVVGAMSFVIVDIGRPDRLLHMIPGIGRFNWPQSMLAWDVLVLNGYLALNLAIPCYVHFCHYRGQQPTSRPISPSWCYPCSGPYRSTR
jgi:hypothetical protein